MDNPILRLYLTVRKPRNFLIILAIFILASLLLHFTGHYDGDFGATNLILSIEASTAGAVLMMVAEQSAEWQRENSLKQAEMLAVMLSMAEAQRDILADHTALLLAMNEQDKKLLAHLEGEES